MELFTKMLFRYIYILFIFQNLRAGPQLLLEPKASGQEAPVNDYLKRESRLPPRAPRPLRVLLS